MHNKTSFGRFTCLMVLLLSGHVSLAQIRPGIPPTRPIAIESMSCRERFAWADQRIGRYRQWIRESARRNRIPSRLLETVVLNEISDYDLTDKAQEFIFSTGSVGIAQMNVLRAIRYGLMGGLISEREIRSTMLRFRSQQAILPGAEERKRQAIEYLTWWKLNQPNYGIEVAAREVSRIFDVMSSNPNQSWTRHFLKGPITRSRPYANAIAGWYQSEEPLSGRKLRAWEASRERVGTLKRFREEAITYAVVAAYNTDSILTSGFKHRWVYRQLPKRSKHPFYNARQHAFNAIEYWTNCFLAAPPRPPVPTEQEPDSAQSKCDCADWQRDPFSYQCVRRGRPPGCKGSIQRQQPGAGWGGMDPRGFSPRRGAGSR